MFTNEMISTHPRKPPYDATALAGCIAACLACEQACTACADACLSETMLEQLRACIRLNLDCADICACTARGLSRLTAFDFELMQAQVGLCEHACRKCAEECERHASMHEHCRHCAQACVKCKQACLELLAAQTH